MVVAKVTFSQVQLFAGAYSPIQIKTYCKHLRRSVKILSQLEKLLQTHTQTRFAYVIGRS